MHTFKRVTVYCGSSQSADAKYYALARQVGTLLAERGIGVVYGGGRVGLMGALADAALAAGGEVIGVIPRRLQGLEVGHAGCTELHVVDGMPLRKSMMIHLGDAFLALPGGYGTWEELLEVTTQAVLNYHLKPVGVVDVDDYYAPLRAMLDRGVEERFVRPVHRDMLLFDTDPVALLDRMTQVQIPRVEDWLGAGKGQP
ncbi:MAG: TIGR00730 family Rossman fold protein [Myxococcales bacterium]|nr:TIGR00730 family Rossman fold protein [Myxococcales bacterium]